MTLYDHIKSSSFLLMNSVLDVLSQLFGKRVCLLISLKHSHDDVSQVAEVIKYSHTWVWGDGPGGRKGNDDPSMTLTAVILSVDL